MTTIAARQPQGSTSYYRTPASYSQAQPVRANPTVDDYEPWYTQPVWNNRMVLALRSGIAKEIEWSLDRLGRLCNSDQFFLKTIPGLLDALFEWPQQYLVRNKSKDFDELMFVVPPEEQRMRRHGLVSLFILRNASVNEANATELARHPRTVPLVYSALINLSHDRDADAEFLVHSVEILQAIAHLLYFPNPSVLDTIVARLELFLSFSTNRSLIIASMSALISIMSGLKNLHLIKTSSPALEAAIRYLPLFADVPLVTTCLEFLYTRLSHPPLLRSFLLHHKMPSTLKLLLSLILSKQEEEESASEISHATTESSPTGREGENYEMTKEELEKLVQMAEPQRSYEWLKSTFINRPTGELTQVDFWNLYKDTFTPYANQHPLLAAAEVIKSVTVVFPSAQAMVLPGNSPRFVIRGIDRRKVDLIADRFQCYWNRSSCSSTPHVAPQELYEHVLEHASQTDNVTCEWASCDYRAETLAGLRLHLLTHISAAEPPTKHSSQPEVSLYTSGLQTPTSYTPPPPPNAKIRHTKPTSDPSSVSLTALLIIRLIFRISSVTTEAAPRADADHFGFPGVHEENNEEQDVEIDAEVLEGERRGRRAIASVRFLMERVQIRDTTLMGWINEMVDVGSSGENT